MAIFGTATSQFNTPSDFSPNQLTYTAKYDYNVMDSIIQESCFTGRRFQRLKGFYHKFEFNFYNISADDLGFLNDNIVNDIVFYPHSDNSGLYFNTNIKKLKPYHFQNMYFHDAVLLTLESNAYANLVTKA